MAFRKKVSIIFEFFSRHPLGFSQKGLYNMRSMIRKRMSAPYREVSSRLKRLLSEGGVIEGSLYRADRGSTPRHQLSDRATGSMPAPR